MNRARALVLASRLAATAVVSSSVAVPIVTACVTAEARPGGGSSFGGGGRSSSGGGSSRSYGGSSSSSGSSSSGSSSGRAPEGGFLGFLFFLLIAGALFGVPGLLAALTRGAMSNVDWSTGGGAGSAATPERSGPSQSELRAELEALRERDANFSLVLFEDFLYLLYGTAHTARGRGTIAGLAAYFSPGALGTLATSPGMIDVRSIVVGAMRYVEVNGTRDAASPTVVVVELETNLAEIAADQREHAYYHVERWTLSRPPGRLSRTPETATVLGCPNCGAPIEGTMGGTCAYCHQRVDAGGFDWRVERVQIVSREPRGPMLTATTEEVGTDLPTIVDPSLPAGSAALSARDPAFDWNAFFSRVALVFGELQTSWSSREWKHVRPFVTDNLFQMFAYWIDAYTKQRLRNVTENPRITAIEPCVVRGDRFFDAITVRVRAESLDYTIEDQSGRVVAGSKTRVRKYTEYWTLVRSAGRTGPSRADKACPNCGAPLSINQAGHCDYCRAKVTSGAFDWVLSRIEQDETYG